MLGLPPIPPTLAHQTRVRLGWDYFLRIAGNDSAIDSAVIGLMVDAVADLETVTVADDGRQLARHPKSWTFAATVIDAEQVVATARFARFSSNRDPLPRVSCVGVYRTATARSVP